MHAGQEGSPTAMIYGDPQLMAISVPPSLYFNFNINSGEGAAPRYKRNLQTKLLLIVMTVSAYPFPPTPEQEEALADYYHNMYPGLPRDYFAFLKDIPQMMK
jgi:hypothetical protein